MTLSVNPFILSPQNVQEFQENGFTILKSFYDLTQEIEPIQYGIYRIIDLLIQKYQLPIKRKPFSSETFDSGFQEIIALDRQFGSELYDAIKQIPAFVRWVVSPKHDAIVMQLRETDLPGIAAGGYGIRIDNPFEEKFRQPLHQDYMTQLRSLDGIVFWSPLVPITEEIGPVQICSGSHKGGIVPVQTFDPEHPDKTASYGLILQNAHAVVSKYPHVTPTCEPGDLLLLDFLTIHCSGINRSHRSRWTMQMRYFNFKEPCGIRYGWCGSFAAGVYLKDVYPDLVRTQ